MRIRKKNILGENEIKEEGPKIRKKNKVDGIKSRDQGNPIEEGMVPLKVKNLSHDTFGNAYKKYSAFKLDPSQDHTLCPSLALIFLYLCGDTLTLPLFNSLTPLKDTFAKCNFNRIKRKNND